MTIVLPCATDDGIASCIASIDEDVDVLAVLNGASEGARQIVRSAGLRCVELPERNVGATYDAGVVNARHDLVMIMNTDCVFLPDAIKRLYAAWLANQDAVIRGVVIFRGHSFASRVVNRLYRLQVASPPRAYTPALVLHRSIQSKIDGYFFDRDMHWAEDDDFDRRVQTAGIRVIHVPEAIVLHARPTLRSNLRSAFRYGIGHRIAEEKGLFGRDRQFNLTPQRLLAEFHDARRRAGLVTGLFAVAWWTSFGLGHRRQRRSDVYGTRRVQHEVRSGAAL
jgi:GT2 family glycosyltransferase